MVKLSAIKDGQINYKKLIMSKEFGELLYAGQLATLVYLHKICGIAWKVQTD